MAEPIVVQQESSPLLMLIVGIGLLLAGMSFLDNRPPQSTSGPPQSTSWPPQSTSGPPKPASTGGPQNLQPAGTGGPPNVKPAGTGGPQNVQPAGPQNVQPAGPQNVQPAGPQNVQPAGPQNVQPAGPQNLQRTSGPQKIDDTAVSDGGSNAPPLSNLEFAQEDSQSDLHTSMDQRADEQLNVAPGSYTTDAPTRRNTPAEQTAAWTPSPTDLGSQSVDPPSAPETVVRRDPSCPAACMTGSKVCTMHMSKWGICGQDELWYDAGNGPQNFGWGAGEVERMARVGDVTDCRECVGVTPPQKACPAVCTKNNCKLHFSAAGYCGDDVLWATVDGKAHDFGWGPGEVARYTKLGLMTDCTGC